MTQLIKSIVSEAMAYDSVEEMENYLDKGMGLENLPIQPLYLALRKLPLDKVTYAIEKMSKEQRGLVLDLELWKKDSIDLENFENWMIVFARSDKDELRFEFAKSTHFHFYLKSKFNIWTFDAEDPLYPDHDNYFLTEDGLLLFEFSEEAENIDEVRLLIRELYYEVGVEEAYAILFKTVSDGYLQLEEREYQEKKSRLADCGLVDYYDALEYKSIFPSLGHIDLFIRNKKREVGSIDNELKGQALHQNSIIAFRDGVNSLESELDKIQDSGRKDFLHFNFLRLINGTISLDGALRSGVISMTKTGKKTKSCLLLGFDYLLQVTEKESLSKVTSLFEYFNFSDIHRIGLTLITIEQKKLKKKTSYFIGNMNAENFLGKIWTDFLDHALELPAVLCFEGPNVDIVSVGNYNLFKSKVETLCCLVPFVKAFNKSFTELKENGNLQDIYYLNYNVDDIDFETILLTSFYNYCVKEEKTSSDLKMGITIEEFKLITKRYLNNEGEVEASGRILIDIANFSKNYGMSEIPSLSEFIILLLKQEVEGYDLDNLDNSEFKFIGGPIILDR